MSGGHNLYRNQKGTVVHRADCRVRGRKVKWNWPDTTEGFGWVGDRPASAEYGRYPLDWVRACKVCRPHTTDDMRTRWYEWAVAETDGNGAPIETGRAFCRACGEALRWVR